MIRLSDVRYTLRLWRRHPPMVAVAGLSLGLGVGATTTMYGVVNRVANYQLGFADPDRLAVLWTGDTEKGIREQPPTWNIVDALLAISRANEFDHPVLHKLRLEALGDGHGPIWGRDTYRR